MNSELISALADGEVDGADLPAALAAAADASGQATWGLYHGIGDALRAPELAEVLSDDFAIRFAARFDAEPALTMPPETGVQRALAAVTLPARALAAHLGSTASMKSVGRFLHLS
ncbi:MAG: RseA family anti-sigma factor [Burkholderiaceae bacterium]